MTKYLIGCLGLLLLLDRLPAQNPPAPIPAIPPGQDKPATPTPDALPGQDKPGAPNPSPDDKTASETTNSDDAKSEVSNRRFIGRLFKNYLDEFSKPMEPIIDRKFWQKENAKDENAEGPDATPRRAPPSPWPAPPFPGDEYQGFPLIGVPASPPSNLFMKSIYDANTPLSSAIKDSRIFFEGWATGAGNWSTAHNSNVPTAYWVVPNSYQLDQLVFKFERFPDTVQTDHIDWGFRSVLLYGMDYRYTTAGGWFSDQLLKNNQLYGWDPVEQYFNVYIPGFLGGTDIRVGRWIACPDIETQYSVNNYLASHSILFTYDTYTDTGIMVTQKINSQWEAQAALHSGTDMAPWYQGAIATGAFGARWVSLSNNDAFYTWLNAINGAEFRHFVTDGQPAGHDNFNYLVTTWEHRFNRQVHTKTEGYYMWQRDAEVGGTPSLGPVQPFGGGGGNGVLLPGLSQTYGILNYTMFGLSKRDYFTVRNEVYRDERGMRTGFAGTYTSHTIGISHQFNDVMMIRPEIGYYRNWDNPAFDNGTQKGLLMYGFDFTVRF